MFFVVFDLVLSSGVIVVSLCCRRYHYNLNDLLIPFLFWVAAEQEDRQLNISLAFFYWVGIVVHPRPFVSDIAIFVLKRDVKLQLTVDVQALGILLWHKHNVDRALADLPNYTPYPDSWTVEDKVLFEQAFYIHGKNFQRIHSVVYCT